MRKIICRAVEVRVPATSANIGPGFDTLGLAVNLFLSARAEISAGEPRILLRGEGADELPAGESNLLFQSYLVCGRAAGLDLPPLRISVRNSIPLKRGLGSSSAAIVAGILIADRMMGGRFTQQELVNIAAGIEGHPDNITPCLTGGIAICCYDGREVVYRKINPPPWLKLVAVIPDMVVETKKARAVLPKKISAKDAVFNLQRVALQVASWYGAQPDSLPLLFEDRLHQPYRKALIPGFEDVISAALDARASGVYLSGSGPTIMALYRKSGKLVGERMAAAFGKAGIPARSRLLKAVAEGPVIRKL